MKKKIALLHPSFSFGGAESVALWTIDALKEEYDIDLIVTEKNIALLKINEFWGTRFKKGDFKIIRLRSPKKGHMLKLHIAQRYFKKHAEEYDVVISTRDEMDFGKRGIQYVNYPVQRSFGKPSGLYKKIYYRFAKMISGYKKVSMKKNITITSSYWAKGIMKKLYSIEAEVIYPPVSEDYTKFKWDERVDGFVCVGRIAKEKNLEQVIGIINDVRTRLSKDIPLHIVGSFAKGTYLKKITELINENSSWIKTHAGLSRDAYGEFLSKFRYGIHGMKNEHFGIAIAEMVKAGCIPFIAAGGGQVEIINMNPMLIYKSKEDCVEKIIKVFENIKLQEELQKKMREYDHFSIRRFKKEIRALVRVFISEKQEK